jgi:excisionase family DNA binding protein
MPSQLLKPCEPALPTEAETELARESSRRLAAYFDAGDGLRLQILDGGGPGEAVAVPGSAVRLLVRILAEMAQGNAVRLVPVHAELTTQEAADLLNVSRPYLVKLLDEGKIPHRTVGKDRRVRFEDLMAYKQKDDAARAQIADQLTAEAQDLGLGY